MNTEFFIRKARAKHGNRYDYSLSEYVTAKTPVKIICPIHGAFLQPPDKHYRHGCIQCSGITKLTTEQWIAKAREKHGDRYDYSRVVYKGNKEKVEIGCPDHGWFWQQAKAHSLAGQGCPVCSGKQKKTREQWIAEARQVHGDKFDYSFAEYKNANAHTTIICPIHGAFSQTPYGHLKGGCFSCARDRLVAGFFLTREEFIERSMAVHSGRYDYSKVVYRGSSNVVTIGCPIHGWYEQTAGNHLHQGAGCPKCANVGPSSYEALVSNWYPTDVRNDRSILGDGKELDLVYQDARVAVEVNGAYWHTEAKGKDRQYHLKKLAAATEAGYRLVQIYDYELDEKSEIVKSMLAAKLGRLSRKIYARDCDVRELTPAQSRAFLNANHLQGYSASSLKLGLWHKEELVAVMTFGKPRYTKGYEWEIHRFATLLHTNVVGGASKLFTYFLRNYTGSVLTYADLRYSDGGLYKQLGFREIRRSTPNYKWVRGAVRYRREQCQKHKLADLLGEQYDPALSEKQNMEAAGFSRLWDCGNIVFEYVR